jgi:hypothetical protein
MSDATITGFGGQLPASSYISTDDSSIQGSGNAGDPLIAVGVSGISPTSSNALVAGTGLTIGMVFYVDNNGVAQPAQSNGTLQQATAVGIVTGFVITTDATTIEYKILDGDTAKVPIPPVKGKTQYVGQTPGSITPIAPISGYATQVGVGLPGGLLALSIGSPIAVITGVERFTINAGSSQAISSGVATTFATGGSGSGTGALTLAAGLSDGFEKTVHVVGTAEEEFTLTPTDFGDGTRITFSGGSPYAGGAILRWDATASLWWIVALYQGTVS